MAAITNNDIRAIFLGEDTVTALYWGNTLVWFGLNQEILFVPDEFEDE